jgi:hypothetical protein
MPAISDTDFYPSRIPDLGSRIPDTSTAPKEEGEIFFCPNIFGGHKYHKIVKKSEIRDPEKTYSGSRAKKAPDPGSRSSTLLVTHCYRIIEIKI